MNKSSSKKNDIFKDLKITICGMGVMGASLGYQLVKYKMFKTVTGLVRSNKNASIMLKMKLAHEIETNEENAITGSNIVILAIPSFALKDTLKKILPFLKSDMLIMDLCSIKQKVVLEAETLLANRAKFVGAHPMTGTEKTGYHNFIPDLYEGAPCILTPTINTDKKALMNAIKFWKMMKVKLFTMTAKEHDTVIANVSHLPHLISYALMDTLLKKNCNYTDIFKFAGGSFRDMTRIAKSSSELWSDILISNQKAVISALKLYRQSLKNIENKMKIKDFKGLNLLLSDIVSGKNKIDKT